MRQRYDKGDLDGAVALARIAAPYLHARRKAATQPADLSDMNDEELDSLRSQD